RAPVPSQPETKNIRHLCKEVDSSQPDQAASIAVHAVATHIFDPARTLPGVGECKSVKTLVDRFDSGEAQHAALEPSYAIGAEVPTIEHHWHAHGHDDASRTSGKQTPREPLFSVLHGKAWPEDVLQKGLEQSWHGSMPEREQKHPML